MDDYKINDDVDIFVSISNVGGVYFKQISSYSVNSNIIRYILKH